jgi:KDO2-lipid IV(A) lauroyltransferase
MKPEPFTADARGRTSGASNVTLPATTRPSALYRAGFWRLGLTVARVLPYHLTARVLRSLARFYAASCPRRRGVVVKNLLPALKGDLAAAERMSRRVFEQFALKLADLWRFESGLPVEEMFTELSGWENFLDAQKRKRGVLLLTPHLGNWEFGGPLLTKRGYKLQVITLAEPGRGFTELRKASRARWGIETLVIGENPFAIIEVIHRLEAGATVALLVDRPAETSAIEVELFGKPFLASCAAAELARASGCELLPVYLPRAGAGYAAHILPSIRYDRPALRSADARQQLTQSVIAAFEPAIREHLDQWYHFVPVWPEATGTKVE